MNQSECQVADWEMIGLEDGSAGKSLSYIGEHRSSCSEFGISPNLSLYEKGHKRGLTHYCVYQNGFDLGARGGVFNSVCAGKSNSEFKAGFDRGFKDHQCQELLVDAEHHWKKLTDAKIDLDKEIEKNEVLLVNSSSQLDRLRLLDELKEMNKKRETITHQASRAQREFEKIKERYEQFQRNSRQ